MTEEPIKFGTDGWRGRIALDFTFDNVVRVARAVSATLRKISPDRKTIIVGYDRRFLSRDFAQAAAAVYAEEGFRVKISTTYLPTPVLSWCAKHEAGAAGATVITASHNPPEWNGFKFKEPFGGSALPALTLRFEEELKSVPRAVVPTPEKYKDFLKSGLITEFNPIGSYVSSMLSHIDLEAIRRRKFSVALDVMYGAASEHYSRILEEIGVKCRVLHQEENPSFRGVPPEPIERNLTELKSLVRSEGFACGLATDGDADRMGAVDENGNYFTTQQILSVVYWHMLTNRKKRWSIARSVSTTRMVDLVAARAGLTCHETPVGFKFIAEKMVAGEAQIGGEESGGVGIIDHLPERDGMLTGLLLLELMAATGNGLAQIYADLCATERPYFFTREDLHLSQNQMAAAITRLKKAPPQRWEGREVDRLLTLDGYKFLMRDGSWILIRGSGTEPIFRLYAEAETQGASQMLIAAAKTFVTQP